MTPAVEPFARLVMQKLGRNPDDWRVIWNTATEFLAMMEAYVEARDMPDDPKAQFRAIRHHERFCPLDETGNPVDPRRRG